MSNPSLALTIAGSEATGGAGAQADLKTFQAHDVFGMVALTCIVSFDPKAEWGHRFVPVDPQVIADQLEAITTAYGPDQLDVAKIGMLGTPATIETVAGALRERSFGHVVLDPVLICKGQEPGAALDTDEALKAQVLPQATFVTPNHFEATSLSGMAAIESVEDLTEAARRIHEDSGAAVLAKGGVRLPGPDAVDVFYDGATTEVLTAPKVGEVPVAGAGCTLAAAVAAQLARG
uniref:PfkB family carbohydrate kinase n=1 Tax=Ornithinicoccus halotolerans TaxID=1748220 RepID=UPI00129792E7